MTKYVHSFIAIAFCVLICTLFSSCITLTIASMFVSMAPYDYTESVQTGGEIEAAYLAMGNYPVDYVTRKGSSSTKKFYIYYPKELKNSSYPVVVMLNGTGVLPQK